MIKRIENPHLTIRPLRQALYHRLGIASVNEVFPYWDLSEESDFKVKWTDDVVLADPLADYFLDNPQKAISVYFPRLQHPSSRPKDVSKEQWKLHVYSCIACVVEICSLGGGMETDFLNLICSIYGIRNSLLDKVEHVFSCEGCSKNVEIRTREIEFFKEKGFQLPKRCLTCRKEKKQKGKR